jgi:hypothetical protein
MSQPSTGTTTDTQLNLNNNGASVNSSSSVNTTTSPTTTEGFRPVQTTGNVLRRTGEVVDDTVSGVTSGVVNTGRSAGLVLTSPFRRNTNPDGTTTSGTSVEVNSSTTTNATQPGTTTDTTTP